MNLSEFIDTYREAITRQVIDTYPPLYRPSPDEESLPKLVRPPLPGQENAIRSTALSLKSQKGSVIVGEMGCGKTYIGITAASLAGFQRVLVLAPPHLTRKWQREVRQTIPGAQASIINSITDLERLRTQPNEGILFGIMSRERAKLSFHWKPAAVWRWARNSKGAHLRTNNTGEIPLARMPIMLRLAPGQRRNPPHSTRPVPETAQVRRVRGVPLDRGPDRPQAVRPGRVHKEPHEELLATPHRGRGARV